MKTKRTALLVGALLVAMLAVSVSSAAAKTVLNLKVPGESKPVASKTKVAAGWYIAFGESYACQLLPEEEGEAFKEEAMTLQVNSSTTDEATGSVAVPECFEVEAEEEGAAGVALLRGRHHAARHRLVAPVVPVLKSVSGTMSKQVIKTSKKGTIELSKALTFKTEIGGLECTYISKTKLKAAWPPEENPEFPNIGKTADLTSEFAYKLEKLHSAKKGCPKSEEGYVESWLGPLGEEFEAELASVK